MAVLKLPRAKRPESVGKQADPGRVRRTQSSCPCPDLLRLAALAVPIEAGLSLLWRAVLGVKLAYRCCFYPAEAMHEKAAVKVCCAVPGSCVGATVLPRLRSPLGRRG